MAIDTSMFVCDIPAGTYSVGDVVPMKCIRGPSVVRDGYGIAKMKKFTCLTGIPAANGGWKVHIQNSNWNDETSNPAVSGNGETAMAENSGGVAFGHDAILRANSGWRVWAECVIGGTLSGANSIVCLIDVDYPQILAVENPQIAQGEPVTIDGQYTITASALGSVETAAVWTTFNVDVFKAGYRYLLTEGSFKDANSSIMGFFSISGAAGQQGLERIIPCRSAYLGGLKSYLTYSTPLVKGPMNINFLAISTAGSETAYLYMDFVKRNL